jgi:hypothetical protein
MDTRKTAEMAGAFFDNLQPNNAAAHTSGYWDSTEASDQRLMTGAQ